MKKTFALVLLTGSFFSVFTPSCTSDSPAPSTDITRLEGEYRTNGAIDLSCVAISNPDEMPQLSVVQKSNGTYSLVRTDFFPSKRTTELSKVTVQAKPDTLLILRDNQKIGRLYLGIWREYSGKKVREMKAAMLWVSMNDTTTNTNFFFLGYRQ
jgi:hypothetical protein